MMQGRPTSTARRPWRVGVAVVLLAGALTACEGLGEQAQQVTDDLRERAGSEVEQAVQDQVDQALERFGGSVDVERICELVADDRLTGAERGRLEVAVEVGEALGLPPEVTSAGKQVLEASDGATDRVGDLSDACAEAGASTGES